MCVLNCFQRLIGDTFQIIQRIRHETDLIATLDPPLRQAAVDSYAMALKTAFRCQTAVAVCTLLACLCIEEYPIPSVVINALLSFVSDYGHIEDHMKNKTSRIDVGEKTK